MYGHDDLQDACHAGVRIHIRVLVVRVARVVVLVVHLRPSEVNIGVEVVGTARRALTVATSTRAPVGQGTNK